MRGLIVTMVLALVLSVPSSVADSGASDAQVPSSSSAPTGPVIPGLYSGSAIVVELANMTLIDTREIGRGAECPRGSGRYCSNAIPYCCRSSSGTSYCAQNSNGCTR